MNAPTTSLQNNTAQNKPFPDELRKWNWGAFFLNWIWGLGNRTYIALLVFVPIANIVMPFVLGAKGNEWAWKNKKWDNLEHFKRVQRLWAIWGVSIFGILVICAIAAYSIAMQTLSDSEIIKKVVNSVAQNTIIIENIGSPIEKKGWPSGSISISGASGYMNGSIDIKGPRGTATVYIKAYMEYERWNIVQLAIRVHKTQELIEITQYPPDSPEMQKFERERQAFSTDDRL